MRIKGYLIYFAIVMVVGIFIISSLPLLPQMGELFNTIFGVENPLQLLEKAF